MSNWIKKPHDFMALNDRGILEHAGAISAKLAKELAESEYEKCHQKMIDNAKYLYFQLANLPRFPHPL